MSVSLSQYRKYVKNRTTEAILTFWIKDYVYLHYSIFGSNLQLIGSFKSSNHIFLKIFSMNINSRVTLINTILKENVVIRRNICNTRNYGRGKLIYFTYIHNSKLLWHLKLVQYFFFQILPSFKYVTNACVLGNCVKDFSF